MDADLNRLCHSILVKAILQRFSNASLFVLGIDGCGRAGKSKLARTISEVFDDSTIVEMDDFYRIESERERLDDNNGYGELFDWKRLGNDVLRPLRAGRKARYKKYDWDKGILCDLTCVEPKGLIILEGVYTTRIELRDYFDFRIWGDYPYQIRLKRGLDRDGEDSRSDWVDLWMPQENKYIEVEFPMKNADFVIDGTSGYESALR